MCEKKDSRYPRKCETLVVHPLLAVGLAEPEFADF